MDSLASNFNPLATYVDGSCPVIHTGCTDSDAANYRPVATRDDDSCAYVGCISPDAINYNPSASLPGECVTAVFGCLDSVATNFYAKANTKGEVCIIVGCTNPTRQNFNPLATHDDGSCTPEFAGKLCNAPSPFRVPCALCHVSHTPRSCNHRLHGQYCAQLRGVLQQARTR